jgi:hypothetical protein
MLFLRSWNVVFRRYGMPAVSIRHVEWCNGRAFPLIMQSVRRWLRRQSCRVDLRLSMHCLHCRHVECLRRALHPVRLWYVVGRHRCDLNRSLHSVRRGKGQSPRLLFNLALY